MPEEKKQLSRGAVYCRRRRERLKAEGLCIDCTKPALEGFVHCGVCREKKRKGLLEHAQRKMEQGRCLCGAKIKFGKRWCQECLDRQSASHKRERARRREQKLCTMCGLPLTELELETGQEMHARDNCYPSRRVY